MCRISLIILTMLVSITGRAQDMYVGSSDALYLHSGAIWNVAGSVTTTANINGAGTGTVQLSGTEVQLIDANNYSVHGISINKSGGKAVLTDSIKIANLDLISGKFLLYSNSSNGYTLNVTNNIKNATVSTKVLVGSRNSSIRLSGAATTADTFYLATDTLNHSNYLKNLFVGNSLTLNDTINITGLTYVSAGYTLNANSPGIADAAYLKFAVLSSTSYGQLQFENGAFLSGKATMGQLVSNSDTWIHWGSPFATSANTTYGNAIADDVTLNYANGSIQNANIFYYDESFKTAGSFWQMIGASTDQIARGRGHAMYTWLPNQYPGYLPTTSSYVLDITGNITEAIFSGNYSANQSSGVQNSDSTGWHVIANPYYCNANLANIDISDINSIQGNTIYYYQTTTGTGTYNNPPLAYNFHLNSSNNGASGIIRPMQAIYFRVADTSVSSSNIALPTKIQGSGNTAAAMWKTSPFTDVLNIRATATSDTNIQDATTLFIMPEAANSKDKNDAFKFTGNYSINVYTSYNEDKSRKMSYNALQDANTSIPLGFSAAKAGRYVLNFNLSEQSVVNKIALEDKATNSITMLSLTDNYSFDYNPSENSDRFVIHFNNNTTSTQDSKHTNQILTNMYVAGNEIKVELREQTNFTVKISNLLGQELETANFSGNKASIPTDNLAGGYYIITVIAGPLTTSQKVFVNN